MEIKGNRVLITGGATGIGFAFAKRLEELGNKVVICGRRAIKLEEARSKLPDISVIKCDISKDAERKMLHDKIYDGLGGINMLVNNAGIQRRIDLTKGREDLEKNEDEVDINLRSQIYLTASFIPHLLKQSNPAIVNVSSGLGFVPLAIFPIYSATKAAMHSFSMSLRHQLRQTPIKVFEVIPPTVHDTELKGKPIEKTDYSMFSEEVAEAALNGIESDEYEIGIGASKAWTRASRDELDSAFRNINH